MFISTETFAHDGVRDIQTDDFHNISLNSHFFLSFFLFSSFLFFSTVFFPFWPLRISPYKLLKIKPEL